MSYSSATFLAALSQKTVCQGWDALVSYEQSPLNSLFAQQWVGNLGRGETALLPPLVGSITVDGTTYSVSSLTLAAPLISFPTGLDNGSVLVSMNILAGSMLVTGSSLSGYIVKSFQSYAPVDEAVLQLDIPLTSIVGAAGPTVNLDLRKGANYTTSILEGAVGEQLAATLYAPVINLTSSPTVYQLGSFVTGTTGLVPTSFEIATQSPPQGVSGGAVVVMVATAFHPGGGSALPDDQPYMIPEGYGATIVVSNPTYIANILQPQFQANLPGSPSVSVVSAGNGMETLSFGGSSDIGVVSGSTGIYRYWTGHKIASRLSVELPYTGLSLSIGAAPEYPMVLNWNTTAPVTISCQYSRDGLSSTTTNLTISGTFTASFAISNSEVTIVGAGTPTFGLPDQGFLGFVRTAALQQIAAQAQPMANAMLVVPVAPINELALSHVLFPSENVLSLESAAMPGDLVTLCDIVAGPTAFNITPFQTTIAPGQSAAFSVNATADQLPVTWTVSKPTVAQVTTSNDGTNATVSVPSTYEGTDSLTVVVTATATGGAPVTTAALNVVPAALQINPTYQLVASTNATLNITTLLQNPSITWTLSPSTGAGTLTGNGLSATYTPPDPLPNAPLTLVTVTATSGDFSAQAVISLYNADPLKVKPNFIALSPQGTQLFTASADRGTPAITWSVFPSTAGTITTGGTFTALTATLPVTIVMAQTAGEELAGLGVVLNVPASM